MTERKIVNPNRFYWNPETKEKIHNEYLILDEKGRLLRKEPINLNEGQKQKAELAKQACIRQSLTDLSTDSIAARKDTEKRVNREEEKEVAEKIDKARAKAQKKVGKNKSR